VHHMIALVRRAREAVFAGRFAAFRAEFLERYHSSETLAREPGADPADVVAEPAREARE
jgi:hypothetical protein